MTFEFAEIFRKNLLSWFKTNARILPWRTEPNLYKTIVSEFMLQQTQVKTVLPFFEKWIERFPNFATLAEATIDEVIHYWAGLGYYSRAKNLHSLAKNIVKHPVSHAEDLLQYKGIGPYTAAAIASIAFNNPIVVIDGNVIRVLARIFNHTEVFISKDSAIKWCTPFAQELLDKDKPGKFNEAIMELGALICTKNAPQCSFCPLKGLCLSFKNNTINLCPQFIQPKRTKQIKKRLWLYKNKQILLEKSNIGNLLELPELTDGRSPFIPNCRLIFSGKRSISTTDYTEEIYAPLTPNDFPLRAPSFSVCKFYPITDLDKLSLSGPHKRWIKSLLKEV